MDDGCATGARDHDGRCEHGEVGREPLFMKGCDSSNGPDPAEESLVSNGLPFLSSSTSSSSSSTLVSVMEVHADSPTPLGQAITTNCCTTEETENLKDVLTTGSNRKSAPPFCDTGQSEFLLKPSELCVCVMNQVCANDTNDVDIAAVNGSNCLTQLTASNELLSAGEISVKPFELICDGHPESEEMQTSFPVTGSTPNEKVIANHSEHLSSCPLQSLVSTEEDDSDLGSFYGDPIIEAATKEVCKTCLPTGEETLATKESDETGNRTDVEVFCATEKQTLGIFQDSELTVDVASLDLSLTDSEHYVESTATLALLDEEVCCENKNFGMPSEVESVETSPQPRHQDHLPDSCTGDIYCLSIDQDKNPIDVSNPVEDDPTEAASNETHDDKQAASDEICSVMDCTVVNCHQPVSTVEITESCNCSTEKEEAVYDVPPVEDEMTSSLEAAVVPSSCVSVDVNMKSENEVHAPGLTGSQCELTEPGEKCQQPSDVNFYEEIKRDRERSVNDSGGQETSDALLFKRGSLVDEVLTEVERVQQRHVQVLQELNLDIENLIMPATPSVSPLTDSGIAPPQPLLPPPAVPPHHSVVAAATPTPEAKSHNPCTRTLPPLPVESLQEPVPLRSAAASRELQQTKSAPASYQVPTSSPAATPTGVKHWLSRLPSFPSFREKKPRARYSDAGVNWRWSVGGTDEPIYMLYDDSHHLHEGQRCEPEDGIYEDIDQQTQRYTMPSTGGYSQLPKSNEVVVDGRSLSSSENNDDNSDNESIRSSGSLSVLSLKGKLFNFGRRISRQEEKGRETKNKHLESNGKPEGKFTRLFSKRKGYDLSRIQGGGLIVEQPEENKLPQLKMSNVHQRPILPPPPSGLSPEQTKRRYIVGTLVHSENSYVASLRKLVHEYKKPLEESSPPILSANKIAVLFHRLPEILQCHTNFCISLAVCVHRWDVEEKIGDVFLHAFSKTSVLDTYSDYINNFSSAMELAKLEAKRKSAFTDFLKMKQITSHDRLSFFGLMVKPVQRFPQFILLLQDLLRHTPQRHHDRMALQLALTQMETMADMLNERKRESDQAHAVKDILRHVSAKSAAKSLSEGTRYLLRQDTLTQLIFNQNGQWMKSKDRKLFLLNDLLVCVSVGPSGENNSRKSERLSFKWSVPITDVEVQEDASPILNRMIYAMTTGQSSATKPDSPNGPEEMEGMKSIYQDLNDLLHDFEVTSRISALVATLKKSYVEISVELMQSLSQSIQQAIQKKDEEVKWIDSCCLQFSVPLKTKTGKVHRNLMIFQSKSMDTKQEWLTDVRLAQLARDVNNSPAWDIPEQERRPSTKIPLFVKAVPVHSSRDPTEVKCGCYHRTMSNRILGRRPQDYIWLCSTDGVNSHISVHTLKQMGLRDVFSFDVAECRISAMESVPSVECPSPEIGLHGDTVWMGTESRRILVFSGSDVDHYQEVGCAVMSASVLHLKYHLNQVYVALANGTVAVFRRNPRGYWLIKEFQVITLGSDPVTCLLPVNASIYCGCGRKVWVVDSATAKVTHNHSVQHDHMGSIYTMAHSGIGLWLNLRNTAQVCLYHAETFQHLQDINITSSVRRVLGDQNRLRMPHYIYITTLTASWGLLWIGTNAGVVLSIPLPRLQGMPILGRRANMAYHANVGPVSTILVLQLSTPLSVSHQKNEIKVSTKGDRDKTVTNGPQADVTKQVVAVSVSSQHARSRLSARGDSLSNLGMAKTLPRSWKSNLVHEDPEYSIYGLYDNLLNVREGVEDPVGAIEEELRHSNPDLIPSLVNTLDRRLRLNSGRPRSLDLANLPLVSDVVCVSSSSEDCGSGSQSLAELRELGFSVQAQIKECELEEPESDSAQRPPSGESERYVSEVPSSEKEMLSISSVTLPKKGPVANPQANQRSVVTLVGGRGYVDLRKTGNVKERWASSSNSTLNPGDAYAILWEMKMMWLEKNRTKK